MPAFAGVIGELTESRMLFISNLFIFLFLPLVLMGFFLIGRKNRMAAAFWLAAASLFFYGWWNPKFVLLLVSSIVINYGSAYLIGKSSFKKCFLILGISIDLGILFLFKYANFFITTLNHFSQNGFSTLELILPLGISFFTFTQIAFLVDVYRGIAAEYHFIHYLLFVTYFPHLIAGPILHHKQMMPQFSKDETYQISAENIAIGLSIFVIGFAKKILLADGFANYATPVFNSVQGGMHPHLIVAWTGTLAFALELYFDFSGYSDMAIGLSRLFGIRLPINFYSPYKSTNIIEFWRRWHISLSTFLRDYLYIPLGGNRNGKTRRYANLFVTMLLGGLWHGANWTYVIWGGLHGFFLIINHAFRFLTAKLQVTFLTNSGIVRLLSLLLTFMAVNIAWVFFRADNMYHAILILKGMTGRHGLGAEGFVSIRHSVSQGLYNLLGKGLVTLEQVKAGYFLGPLLLGLAIIWFLPNSAQLFNEVGYCVNAPPVPVAQMKWKTSFGWAFLLMLILGLSFIKQFGTTTESPFLYFQF